MTRIYATPRKALELKVSGMRVIRTATQGKSTKRWARSFRNRYALRKYLAGQVRAAVEGGFVAVNR